MAMPDISFAKNFSWDTVAPVLRTTLPVALRVTALVLLGIPLVCFLAGRAQRATARRYSAHQAMLVGKVIYYTGFLLIAVTVLLELRFPLSPILGVAGIVGVAVGFASQTTVSNMISGLFLILEKPFVVDDMITMGDTTGQVLSIDLLSVKLRTPDGCFVRIPNETILKSQVTNISRFPTRRLDVNISVAYKENIGRVRAILLDIAQTNPLCLQEPEPLVIFSGFGASGIDLLFAVWSAKDNYLKLKNEIQETIKKRFDEEGIEIPFPHVSVYCGAATAPFPVKLAGDEKPSAKV